MIRKHKFWSGSGFLKVLGQILGLQTFPGVYIFSFSRGIRIWGRKMPNFKARRGNIGKTNQKSICSIFVFFVFVYVFFFSFEPRVKTRYGHFSFIVVLKLTGTGYPLGGENVSGFWPDFCSKFWPDLWPGFWPGFLDPKIQCTGLLGRRNTVYSSTRTEKTNYLLFTIRNPKIPKLYFRHSIILFEATFK